MTMRMKLGENQYGDEEAHAQPHPGNGNERMFKFTRNDLIRVVDGTLGDVTLEVSGSVNGCEFAGTDEIKVINPGKSSSNGSQQGQQASDGSGEVVDEVDDGKHAEPILDLPEEEVEIVEKDDSTSDPEQDDSALDDPQQDGQDEPEDEPEQIDPPKNQPDTINEDDGDKGPVTTNPPADVPATDEDDEPVEKPQPLPVPAKTDPPTDQNDPEEDDIPVKQPVTEPEVGDENDTIRVPSRIPPSRERQEIEDIDEEAPADEPEAPDPPVDEPEPEEPVVDPPVQETPPEVVEEQPEEAERCPIDAEVRITPQILDINGDVEDVALLVRLPGSVSRSAHDLASVEVRVLLGEDRYGDRMVEAKPDAEHPRRGEFELTLEQMIYLLEDRLGEVTLEVSGVVDGCEFAGTDTLEVIATPVVEEPEPDIEEPEEVQEQPEPVEDVEQPESVEEVEAVQPETTESDQQDESTPVEDEDEEETVENPEQVGALEPEDVEPRGV